MLSHKIGSVLFSPFVLSLSKYVRGDQSDNSDTTVHLSTGSRRTVVCMIIHL